MAQEFSPSPPKHSRSPDEAQTDASPKRHKCHHHRRTHRHRSPEPVATKPIEEDEIEEGEILDAAAAMDADADSQASLAPVSLSPPFFP
jgi:serine/threonine-protein kinase PRP4